MKSSNKRLVSLLLTVCMFSSIFCTFASAVEARSSAYLDSYVCSVVPESGGEIWVSVAVNAVVNATMIGASDIYLYESSDNLHFTCVEHFNYEDYPDMMDSGRHFADDVVCYDGTVGRYYYARVYVYAGDSTGYDSKIYETSVRQAIA